MILKLFKPKTESEKFEKKKMGSLGALLKHPNDFYPLLKLKMAARQAEKQIPPEPHWGFCYSMLHKVSRSFALVIQQLGTELRDAVSRTFFYIIYIRIILIVGFEEFLMVMVLIHLGNRPCLNF